MKRTAIFISMLVLLLSVGLVSCDAMFQTNLFAKLTHPTPSAADMATKSPGQLQEYMNSATNLKMLANDAALKEAALSNLAAYYVASPGNSVDATLSDVQTAAIVAADIAIKTIPDAAGLSNSILAYVASGSNISTDSNAAITSLVEQVLPQDIAASLTAGDAMPTTFVDMIDAFMQANAAYQVLGKGLAGSTTYADGTDVSTNAKTEIAVNAVIAGLLCAIEPATMAGPSPTSEEIASSLWDALLDPTNPTPAFTIPSATFDDLIGTGASPTPTPISNLLTASGLDQLFTGGK